MRIYVVNRFSKFSFQHNLIHVASLSLSYTIIFNYLYSMKILLFNYVTPSKQLIAGTIFSTFKQTLILDKFIYV